MRLHPPPPPLRPLPPEPEDTSTALDVTLACGVLCLGVLLHHMHGTLLHKRRCGRLPLTALFTETSTLLCVGVAVNCVAWVALGNPLSVALSDQIHDLVDCLLVPPIMLEVGFRLEKLSFIKSLPAALLFGVVGSLLAFACCAALVAALSAGGVLGAADHLHYSVSQALVLAAILASTEPAAILELLPRAAARRVRHVLVGEAALNGALAVALFSVFRRACQRDAAAATDVQRLGDAVRDVGLDLLTTLPGSTGFGLAAGLALSLLTHRLRMATAHRPYGSLTLLVGFAFGTYNLAARCGLNGDLAIFVAGATLRGHAYHNLSWPAQLAVHDLVGTLAFLGDTSLSLLMGLAAVDYLNKPWAWDLPLILLATPVLMLSRAVGTLPLAACSNSCGASGGGEKPLPPAAVAVVLLAGVRGSVPFALAIGVDDRRSTHRMVRDRRQGARLVTSTLGAILLTNLLMPPLVSLVLTCAKRRGRARVGGGGSGGHGGGGHGGGGHGGDGGHGGQHGCNAALLINDSMSGAAGAGGGGGGTGGGSGHEASPAHQLPLLLDTTPPALASPSSTRRRPGLVEGEEGEAAANGSGGGREYGLHLPQPASGLPHHPPPPPKAGRLLRSWAAFDWAVMRPAFGGPPVDAAGRRLSEQGGRVRSRATRAHEEGGSSESSASE
jgi:NhaP-type Na+/H+ or K+/H+ antiporter